MSKKVVLELEAKTGQTEASLQDVVNAIKELKEETKDAGEGVEELGKSGEKSGKGLKKVSSGFKGIGLAWKAIGIGAIISAFVKLAEVLGKNQRAADFFSTVFEGVNIVINDLIDLVIDGIKPVKDFFKSAFENPQKALKDFGQAVKDNLIERFNSFLDTLGYVADAITKVFKGDFSGALDSIKDAGKEMVDVYTGVNNSVDKVVDATVKYTKNVKKQAEDIVKLSKNVELLKAINDGLIESYDVQAEKQRQIRDDETLTFAERKKANDKLGEILKEQGDIMKANAQTAVDLARARKKENDNDANKLALQEALNEQAAIEARVTGQQSEQLVNVNSLEKERLENKKELLKIGKEGRDLAEIESQQELDNQIMMINKTIENEEEKNRLLEAAKKAHDKRMSDYDAEQDAKKKEKEDQEKEKKRVAKEQKEKDDAEALARIEEQEQRKRDLRNQTFDDMTRLAGEETKVGKALLVAKALLNAKEMIMDMKATLFTAKNSAAKVTMKAAEAGVDVSAGAAKTAAATPFPKNIPMIIGYAVQAASIISSIKSAVSMSKQATKGMGGGVSSPSLSASTSVAPDFNVVGSGGASGSQLANVINQQTSDLQNNPQRAYVVSNDVTTAQSMDRNIIDDASLGD
jgi:hypothetical protein